MCGITVYISKDKSIIPNSSSIEHRGPDYTNIHKFNHKDYTVNLVFNRLSIIDINHGDQPFIHRNGNRKTYLLCNGEIYNYKRLCKKYDLKTESDCHVIIDLYLKFGIKKTISELEGEFAFVIIDIIYDKIEIIYARDRFGIRPLFFHHDNSGYYISSELKGLPFDGKGCQVQPRMIYDLIAGYTTTETPYYTIGKNTYDEYNTYDTYEDSKIRIRDFLISSVKDRMQSERKIGALLSGGLDSSLICGIASKILAEKGERLHTFTIAMEEDASDIEYARMVAKHINSVHHEVIIPVSEWISCLPDVVRQIETYDITTIRATCGQYLISKWIKKNTDIKVLLVGDGSDEIASGYKYFYNTPSAEDAHEENLRLLNNIHKYDVLRCDRGVCAWGIEVRVPFLCHKFVDFYLSCEKEKRIPIKKQRIEKYLLRQSFEDEDKNLIIPREVLYRDKNAFSDSVSNARKSFFEYIHEYVENLITDEEYQCLKFPNKEAYWYYKIYSQSYPTSNLNIDYWLPKWCNGISEPSARVIKL